MREPSGGFGLGVEPADLVRRRQSAGQNHFQRHGAVQIGLPGLEDDAHAAPADFTQQFIFAENLRRFRVWRGHDRIGRGQAFQRVEMAEQPLAFRLPAEHVAAGLDVVGVQKFHVPVEQLEELTIFVRRIFAGRFVSIGHRSGSARE